MYVTTRYKKGFFWSKNGKHHRNNLPAIECINGDKYWFQNGRSHRENDLPAIEYLRGDKYWFKHGQRHRENDLPAIIRVDDGCQKYYNYGSEYFFITQENGTKEYYASNGLLNKANGPAVFYSNGDVEYWYYGRRHRTDGPAVIIGNKQYFFEFGELIKCIV